MKKIFRKYEGIICRKYDKIENLKEFVDNVKVLPPTIENLELGKIPSFPPF